MYNYDRNIIVTAYRASHADDLDPKEKTLQKFDGDLFARFDAELRRQAPGMGIPVDDFSRSILVFFASQSTAKTVRTQVTLRQRALPAVRAHATTAARRPGSEWRSHEAQAGGG